MLAVRTRTKVKVELFATNLRAPSHMEWTMDDRLLVSEQTAGAIKDITDGGDMQAVEPFAFGLQGPSSILPLADGRILATEMWAGRITDISGGGDVSRQEPVVQGLSRPYSLARANGSVFATERRGPSAIAVTKVIDIEGGTASPRAHVTGIPTTSPLGLVVRHG